MQNKSTSRTPRVIVIGGGITGLSAAYRLTTTARRESVPLEVILLEASNRPGGTLATTRRDGVLFEHGPDAFISAKPWGTALCEELGIADQLVGTNPDYRRSFIVRGRRLLPVPDGFYLLAPSALWPMVRTPIFSVMGKLRMGLDLFIPKKTSGDDESLAQFVRRRLGTEALERMAQPMIGGIYAADPELLSLQATMPQFIEMEQKYGSVIRGLLQRRRQSLKQGGDEARGTSGPRYGMFLSFRDGMQTLIDTLMAHLPAGTIRKQTPVDHIRFDSTAQQWEVVCTKGETLLANAVCVAAPAPAATTIVRNLDPEMSALFKKIPYGDSTTVNFVFHRKSIGHALDGMGFVVPAIEGRCILGCSFSSQKFAGRANAEKALLRVFMGGGQWADRDAMSDDAVVQAALAEISELLSITEPPLDTIVSRYPHAMAQYHVGHLDRVEQIYQRAAQYTGLALAGNAYRGVGIPDCIHSADRAAASIFTYLRTRD